MCVCVCVCVAMTMHVEWDRRYSVWSGRGGVVCGVGVCLFMCVCVCVCVTLLSSFRRLRFTSDPLQANKLVSVNLPLLSLHLDEDKAGLLVQCRKAVLSCTNCYKFGDILEAIASVVDN